MVGGGIHGAAVARDAALRGFSVLLLEARDLASGTSGRTSKLVHGGIRYLETAQFGLVREALRERAILLETASPFVRPLPFLIPHYRSEGRHPAWVGAGLFLYSILSGRHRLSSHRRLGAPETLTLEPRLEPRGLLGGSLFWDAQMDDALLCVAVAMDAAASGAEIRTHTALAGLTRDGSAWRARFRDAIDGSEGEARAFCVVNAAGPWADGVRSLPASPVSPSMRRTRGSHVVLPALAGERALLLTARRDGRVFFVLPWGHHSLVGTTDVDDQASPDSLAPPPEDIRYLLEEAGRFLPALAEGPRGDGPARPVRAFAGMRSLARGRSRRPWANPREHRLIEERGMITLVGGKYTTHRRLAERVIDRIEILLERRRGPCRTAERPVGSDRADRIAGWRAAHPGRVELDGGLALTEAEVAHAVKAERARRLEDVLVRRTRLWLDARALRRAAEPASRWMSAWLDWDEARRQREVETLGRALDEEERRIEEAMR